VNPVLLCWVALYAIITKGTCSSQSLCLSSMTLANIVLSNKANFLLNCHNYFQITFIGKQNRNFPNWLWVKRDRYLKLYCFRQLWSGRPTKVWPSTIACPATVSTTLYGIIKCAANANDVNLTVWEVTTVCTHKCTHVLNVIGTLEISWWWWQNDNLPST